MQRLLQDQYIKHKKESQQNKEDVKDVLNSNENFPLILNFRHLAWSSRCIIIYLLRENQEFHEQILIKLLFKCDENTETLP